MLSHQVNLVFVCDQREENAPIDLYSVDLECSSDYYYSSLCNALSKIGNKLYCYHTLEDFIDNINRHKNDLVLASVWSGTKSRNRKILLPSICESYGIPFLGADAYASALSQDKVLSKLYCQDFNISVPRGIRVNSLTNFDVLRGLPYPVVVKPTYEGSSIGISDNSIADGFSEAVNICKKLLPTFPSLLVEEYIPGEEISCCLAGVNGNVDLLEFVEIYVDGKNYFEHELWGFETKKRRDKKTERKVITDKIADDVKQTMKDIFVSLGKVDYMRIDTRKHNEQFYLIELTPDCNLQPNCFMGTAFLHAGYTYEEMIRMFIDNAIKYYQL